MWFSSVGLFLVLVFFVKVFTGWDLEAFPVFANKTVGLSESVGRGISGTWERSPWSRSGVSPLVASKYS